MTQHGAPITEADWQQQVVDLAHMLGWRTLHVRRSIGKGRRWTTTTSIVGWPDLLLYAPGRGFVALELKVGRNEPSEQQLVVLQELAAAGAQTMVAYPEDLDAVASLLRRHPVTV